MTNKWDRNVNRIYGLTIESGAGSGSGDERGGRVAENKLWRVSELDRQTETMIFEHIKMRSSDYFDTKYYSSNHSIKLYKRSIYLMVSNSDTPTA